MQFCHLFHLLMIIEIMTIENGYVRTDRDNENHRDIDELEDNDQLLDCDNVDNLDDQSKR